MGFASLRRLLGLVAVCLSAWASAALTPGLSQKVYSTASAGDPILDGAGTVVPGALFACKGAWNNMWSSCQYTGDGGTYTMCWSDSCWVYSGFWYLKGGTEYHFARQYGYGAYLSFELTPEGQSTRTIFGKSGGLATASYTPEADGWCQIRIELSPNDYNCGPSATPFTTVNAGLLWNAEPGLVECTDENVGSWKKFINTEEETFLYVGVPGIKTESEIELAGADGLGLGWVFGFEEGQSYTFTMSKYATNSTFSTIYKCAGWTLTATDGTSTTGKGNKVTIVYDSTLEQAQLIWSWTEVASLTPGMHYGKSSTSDEWTFEPTTSVVSSTGLAFAGYKEWSGISYGNQTLDIGTAAYAFWMHLNKGEHLNISRNFNNWCNVRIAPLGGEFVSFASPTGTYIPTESGWYKVDIRFTNNDWGSVGCNVEPYASAKRAVVWNIDGPTEVTAENITTEWYRFANEDFEVPLFWAEVPPEVGLPPGTVLYLR